MNIIVINKEDDSIRAEYIDVKKVEDTFTDTGLLAYCLHLKDGSTATFNKMDWDAFKIDLVKI